MRGRAASRRLSSLAFLLALGNCSQESEPTAQDEPTPWVMPGVRAIQTDHFATSACCANCHGNSAEASALRDKSRRPVSPHNLWRASMMANAARDPIWRAQVALEVAAKPGQKAQVEATCMRCHSPMATAQAHLLGEALPTMALLEGGDERAEIARDGVACTLCHQIQDQQLGSRAAMGGGFTIGTERTIFGPYGDIWSHPMLLHASYVPKPGRQVSDSGLCGTCHGWIHGGLEGAPEVALESTFLEWRNSAYRVGGASPGHKATTCQGCHMPLQDVDGQAIRTAIAHNKQGGDYPSLSPRAPFARHDFVGGNTLVPAILRDHRADLRPDVPKAAFDAIIATTRRQLQQRSASMEILAAEAGPDALHVRVKITNLAGHRLPSSFPGRRLWLRMRVRDAAGQTLWATGEHDERGRILGADGLPLAAESAGGPMRAHGQVLQHADQVQIYEAIPADAQGQRSPTMLGTVGYLKDNRLLPQGWRHDGPDAVLTLPQGIGDDEDFGPGVDQVRWRVAHVAGAARVEVALLYQPLGARHLAEMLSAKLPEVQQLKRLLKDVDLGPELLCSAATSLSLR